MKVDLNKSQGENFAGPLGTEQKMNNEVMPRVLTGQGCQVLKTALLIWVL